MKVEDLLTQREKMLASEMNGTYWNKLQGNDIEPGNTCKIIWADWGNDSPDTGYLFSLPETDEDTDLKDYFIHVPHPSNPDGKDNGHSQFAHLYFMLSNPLVKKIIVLHR